MATEQSLLLWLVLLDCAIKSVVILAMTWLVVLVFQRSSAALRHLLWTAVMTSLLFLPVLTCCLPDWGVPILPTEGVRAIPQISPTIPKTVPPILPDPPAEGRLKIANRAPQPDPPQMLTDKHIVRAEPSLSQVLIQGLIKNGQAVLVGVWLLGVVIGLIPLLVGWFGLLRLGRDSQELFGSQWDQLRSFLSRYLNLPRPVRLFLNPHCRIPMAAGFLKPRVILPPSFVELCPDSQRMLLLHEYGHIQRSDGFTQLFTRIIAGLYWFNPLVWFALERMRIEREQACDDLVLKAGVTPSAYAEELLRVAQEVQGNRFISSVALMMVRPGRLERRLKVIFDQATNRRTLPGIIKLSILVATGCGVLVIAVVKPIPAVSDEAITPPKIASPSEGIETPRYPPSFRFGPKPPERIAKGQVTDAETGQPLTDTFLAVGKVEEPTGVVSWHFYKHVQSPTGGYDTQIKILDIGPYAYLTKYRRTTPKTPLPKFRIRAKAYGYAWQQSEVYSATGEPINLNFQLSRQAPIRGTLLLPDGPPAPNIPIRLTMREDTPEQEIHHKQLLTDSKGQFPYPDVVSAVQLLSETEHGYLNVMQDSANYAATLRLEALGRVEGRLYIGSTPATNQPVELWMVPLPRPFPSLGAPIKPRATQTDMNGSFTFDKVPPELFSVSWSRESTSVDSCEESRKVPIKVTPNQTTRVELGGKGGSIIWNVTVSENVRDKVFYDQQTSLMITTESEFENQFRHPFSLDSIKQSYAQTEHFAQSGGSLTLHAKIQPDGSFRIDELPPGKYSMLGNFAQGPCKQDPDRLPYIGDLPRVRFEVPEETSQPVSLPTIEFIPRHASVNSIGSEWNSIEGNSTKGEFIPDGDETRYLLLHYWAPWHPGSVDELTVMKRIYREFGHDLRLWMAGVIIGETSETLKNLSEQYGLEWEQVALNEWQNISIFYEQGIDHLPSTFLITPDKKIQAMNLRGEEVYTAVKQALGL